jgi:Pentapeptide repeats (9 copies)
VITLEQWKSNFADADTCPWRGPQPMEPGDDELLIGRDRDRERFIHDVLSHQLVILHGGSGVGKSSLLNVGLIGDLEARGFQPVVCRNWTRDASSPDHPGDFVAGKVAAELRDLGIDVDTAAPQAAIEQLNDEWGELAVLVLDQFEELIRHQRVFFKRAIDWLVQVNRKFNIHVVITLRSEYLHRLRPLISRMRDNSMTTFELDALTAADDIRDVIASGNPGQEGSTADDGVSGLAITDEAIKLLLDAWEEVQGNEGRVVDVGLLHLQGALYALHSRARLSAGSRNRGHDRPYTVEAVHVEEMMCVAEDRRQDVFTLGLSESVARKLDLCEEACRSDEPGSGLDEFLMVGTREVVLRLAPHLSSGGFKLDREAWDLAELALERELEILNDVPVQAAEQAFRMLYGLAMADPDEPADYDLLSVPRSKVAEQAGICPPSGKSGNAALAELGIPAPPWEVDPEALSAGPMFGFPPYEVLIEELRRFAFALEWLTTSSLIRQISPEAEITMLSLIHDGFGDALENWADAEDNGPAEALNLLTGAQGETFEWMRPNPEEHWPQFDGAQQNRVIVNLRWRACLVNARFRHVVFANCDFRGTRFEKCHFEGVVFVNCLVDGATFGDCDIVGSVSKPSNAVDKPGMPSFILTGVDASTRDALSHYRGQDFSGEEIYSVASGIAVTNRMGTRSTLLEWTPQRGGLTMYGGRLSSLMLLSGRFRDDGELSLRHTAGSSLDISEQGAAKIHIFGSSIRGLSISRRVRDAAGEGGDIELTVQDSTLANTWFDDGLTGTAVFQDSTVWQLLNVSDRFRVVLNNCIRFGAVNIEVTSNAGPMADFSEDGIGEAAELHRQARLMTYWRDPAMAALAEWDGQ